MDFFTILVTFLLATAFLVLYSKRLTVSIVLMAAQSLIMALTASWWGQSHGFKEIYLAAVLLALIKGLAVPRVLLQAVRKMDNRLELGLVGSNTLLMLALGLVVLAFYITPNWAEIVGLESEMALAAAVGMILVGLVIMIGKRLILTQVLGLLVMENGLFLTALVMTGSLPIMVEMGIIFDALVGVLIMAMFSTRIYNILATQDTKELATLKG